MSKLIQVQPPILHFLPENPSRTYIYATLKPQTFFLKKIDQNTLTADFGSLHKKPSLFLKRYTTPFYFIKASQLSPYTIWLKFRIIKYLNDKNLK